MSESESTDKTIVAGNVEQFTDPRFKIRKRLGSGGMGDVYLAEDSSLHRLVALKTVRSDLCKNEEVRKRIERECLLHARVGAHPHIVTLFDKLERGDNINLVMEYVDGTTLQETFRECAHKGFEFSKKDALDIASQVLEALSRIHAQGIVHRDIKPENILLARDDSGAYCAKLMDFGIARLQDPEEQATCLTSEGMSPGTPVYMAPEQIDPKTYGPASPATDIYAVGVMLFQLLTGRPPFTGTITEIFKGHLTEMPPALEPHADGLIPAPYADVLRIALSKEPTNRYPSAKAFREELLRLLASATSSSHRGGAFSADTSRTVVASAIDSAAIDTGGTRLAGTTTTRHGQQGKRWGLIAFVVAVVAIAAVAAVLFLVGKGKPAKEASETQPKTPAATTAPSPESATPATPAAVEQPSTAAPPAIPPVTPPSAPLPTPENTQAVAPSAPPSPSPATPPTTTVPAVDASPATTPPQGSGGSALDELLKNRPSEPAAPEPEPPKTSPPAAETPKVEAPKSEQPPAPKPEPKPGPKAEPKPEPKPEPPPAPKPEPAADDWLKDVKPVETGSHKVQ